MTNQEIANLISERIGPRPVPFESVRALCLEIYQDLGGTEDDEHFEDIYQILIETIPLAAGGGGGGGGSSIDDHNVSTGTTWSSSRIVYELGNYVLNSSLDEYATKNYVDLSLALKLDTLIAGDNITIENNVISATGGGSFDPSNYYNKTQIDDKLALKANESELANYATIANVDSSLALKADKTYVDTSLANKVNTSEMANYATKNDISTFIDATALNGYATEQFVNSSLANYATIANVDASLALKATVSVLTQAQYDALVQGGTVDSSTLYIISDVQ